MKAQPIADWKNIGEYPKWNSASLKRFAWEFLRRNQGYQNDWAEYMSICRGIAPDYDTHVNRSEVDIAMMERHPDYSRYEPPLLDGENENEWLKRVKHGTRTPLPTWYAKKWKLNSHFPDPFYAYEKSSLGFLDISFKSEPVARMVTEHWDGFNDGPIYSLHRQDALAFDCSLPIEPQLAAAASYLKRRQAWLVKEGVVDAFPNKIPRKEWVVYLRLLDADAVNIKPLEIASVLYKNTANTYPNYGGTKAVNAALSVAKQWRDSWYHLIPALKKTPCKN